MDSDLDLVFISSFVAIFFGLPLAVALSMGALRRRSRRRWVRIPATVLGALGALAFLGSSYVFPPYFWALHLDAGWQAQPPRTRAELESAPLLGAGREIARAVAFPGVRHSANEGQRILRYRVLWLPVIDVIYDGDDRVVEWCVDD